MLNYNDYEVLNDVFVINWNIVIILNKNCL